MLNAESIAYWLFVAGAVVATSAMVSAVVRGKPQVLLRRSLQRPEDYTPGAWRVYQVGLLCWLVALIVVVVAGLVSRR